MRRTIIITVDYDEATVNDQEIFDHLLEKEVDRAIADGMLSPRGEEIVDQFKVDVEDTTLR